MHGNWMKMLILAWIANAVPAVAGYADLADLALAAPIVARGTVADSEALSPANSPGIAPGRRRLLMKIRVDSALIAPDVIPATLNYLWDAPSDGRGKAPKLKGETVLLFLASVAADGKALLIGSGGQRPWNAADEAQVRAIVAEARGGTVPVITGIDRGFRDVGTLAGESESQFFLTTADGKGVTLVVISRPGEQRRVALARGDIIDESAAPVRRDTLLWYRLACALPPALPSKAGTDPALVADYAGAIASLGPCGRTR